MNGEMNQEITVRGLYRSEYTLIQKGSKVQIERSVGDMYKTMNVPIGTVRQMIKQAEETGRGALTVDASWGDGEYLQERPELAMIVTGEHTRLVTPEQPRIELATPFGLTRTIRRRKFSNWTEEHYELAATEKGATVTRVVETELPREAYRTIWTAQVDPRTLEGMIKIKNQAGEVNTLCYATVTRRSSLTGDRPEQYEHPVMIVIGKDLGLHAEFER
ncbi:TPA: hypothetical protein HA265_04445 [Candidatus Woesearchaeota archaeon]|nr:hypothetical protein [Candidatus Woesearchaeota archaeon]